LPAALAVAFALIVVRTHGQDPGEARTTRCARERFIVELSLSHGSIRRRES